MIPVEDIKARVDCVQLIESLGGKRKAPGRYTAPWRAESDGGSVSVKIDKWFDHVTKDGGDCVTMVALTKGLDAKRDFSEILHWLATWAGMADVPEPQEHRPAEPGRNPVAFYDYTDEQGTVLYQVVRYEPKDFKQRHPDGKGGWLWNLKDVRLVPYRLPAVMAAECVWIVEGEKDANTLVASGECATTNAGGAGKWLDAYSEYLRGKEVILCGDNDKPGEKHIAGILKGLAGKVSTVTVVTVPAPHKDITDLLVTVPEAERVGALDILTKTGKRYPGGVDLPILGIRELADAYRADIARANSHGKGVDITGWLPSLRGHVRRLVPGEVVTIVADTGCGKSMLLQQIAFWLTVPVLFFEMELPEALMFERFAAMALHTSCSRIEEAFATGPGYDVPGMDHIFVCPVSRMSVATMTDITNKAELRMGKRPVAVMVDYIQLLEGKGERYERTSDSAEAIKRFAKETQTVVFIASQRSRGQQAEIKLHDGRDSSSIENSSGLVIGAWKDPADKDTLILKILKNTKGTSGITVKCHMNGAEMTITDTVASQVSRTITDDDATWATGAVQQELTPPPTGATA
jgi:hypothetical protein